MGAMLLRHHQIGPNFRRTGTPASFCSSQRRAPQLGFRHRRCAGVASETNGAPPPRAARKKHSREELVAFFRDIQASIAESSPKASRRRRTTKPSPDPFQEVDSRKPPYGIGDDAASDALEEHRKAMDLDGMKVAELRELARARRMKGYSRLPKAELIDRLKRAM